jgi:hypothetical protein
MLREARVGTGGRPGGSQGQNYSNKSRRIAVIRGVEKLALVSTLATSLCWMSAPSNAGEYYRWLDDRGNPVHSDRPPPQGISYEIVKSRSGSSSVERFGSRDDRTAEPVKPAPRNELARADANRPKPAIEKNATYCAQAQQNLQTLETAPRIRLRGADGEYRFLSAEERDQQIQSAQATIGVHCD